MRCLHLGRWAVNPYQKLLVEQLTHLGVEVVERELDPRTIGAVLRECRPDVLHLQGIHGSLTPHRLPRSLLSVVRFLLALLVARRRGVRVVWTIHDLGLHENEHPLLDRLLTAATLRLAHARIVHCAATPVRDAVIIPHGHYIGYYPNTVDRRTARLALGVGDDEFVFLLLGWLRPYKGVPELIDTFRQLDAGRLIIAGQPLPASFADELHERAAGDPRISIHASRVPDDRIQEYLNACDVVVLPYRQILTSGAAILAMSFGRSCIVPKIGCMEEMLDPSGAFFYDEGGLGEAVRSALHSPVLERMGEHNRLKVAQWTWESVAERTVEVYRGVNRLQRQRRPSP